MASTSRVWLITGTSTGFGRALAEAVVARGDRLVAAVRRPETAEDLRRADPDRVRVVQCDVTNFEQVTAAVDTAVGDFGRLDVLVNNAGYGLLAGIEEATDDQIRTQFEVNTFGVFGATRAALPVFRRQRSGHVIMMSSIAGQLGMPGLGYYDASKFAVEGFAEALAGEGQAIGLTVTILEPGNFRTNWAGASMTRSEPIAEYEPAIGPTRELFAGLDGNQPGDPAKVAAAIIRMIDEPEPPLRLVMGADALEFIGGKIEKQTAEMKAWEQVSKDSDFDDQPGEPAPEPDRDAVVQSTPLVR
jgi:NAD(P)-dependent dehydrogenase (short-subunit alcohol dehydrogenase family)